MNVLGPVRLSEKNLGVWGSHPLWAQDPQKQPFGALGPIEGWTPMGPQTPKFSLGGLGSPNASIIYKLGA